MRSARSISAAILVLIGGLCAAGVLHWTINRVYVPPGQSLLLRYRGPLLFGSHRKAKPGNYAEAGEVGVLEQLRGPGRHFYCPLWWERKLVADTLIRPGEVAIVTSKLGDPLPQGEFLVDGDLDGPNRAKHKGILRKVLGPGRYRINPYGFTLKVEKTSIRNVNTQAKYSGWVEIPTGYVGVVTFKADNPGMGVSKGVQSNVLPPGLYPVNSHEQEVDIVEIGFRETSIQVETIYDNKGEVVYDESGEPTAVPHSGIGFPSNDGFDIQMDFTAVWGVMPADAPQVVLTFGSIKQAEEKVIIPQSESICRNNGSKMGAVELLEGGTREQFQEATTEAFQSVLEEKDLTLLYGLVRHVYIPRDVRVPIQNGYIADELKLTREQERLTAVTEASLREAEKKVELEGERIIVETEKLVASVLAEGQREAGEIAAETKQMVAEVDKQIAELEAEKIVKLGEAKAMANQLSEEAKAQKFQLAVEAFGSPDSYNMWEFAEGLPQEIDLQLFYAGEGTLWTDLKGVMPTLPLRDSASSQKSGAPRK